MTEIGQSTSKKYYWVETDGEPDDIQALLILTLTGEIKHIVAGESTAPAEIARSVGNFMHMLTKPKPCIMAGLPSEKEFPLRGDEHVTDAYYIPVAPYSENDYILAFKSFVVDSLVDGAMPVFVGLKPPRELMVCHNRLTGTMNKVVALSYGGFNFRTILSNKRVTGENMIAMFANFKTHFVYESFYAAGVDNSVNSFTDPQLFESVRGPSNIFGQALRRLIFNWNECLVEDCYSTCLSLLTDAAKPGLNALIGQLREIKNEEAQMALVSPLLNDPNQVSRFVLHNIKPMKSIYKNEDGQFLLADQCAVLAFVEPGWIKAYAVQAEMSFTSNYYTQFKACDEGSTYYFKGIPREEMVAVLQRLFLRYL
jgi:hypothetical protein